MMGNAGGSPTGKTTVQLSREQFLRDWEVGVNPAEKKASEAYKAAIDYSALGLKSALIINGGALVALPAILSMLGNNIDAMLPIMFCSAKWFVAGIISASMSILFSFFTVVIDYRLCWSERDKSAYELQDAYYVFPGHKAKIDRENQKIIECKRIKNVMLHIAMGAISLSVLFFVIGAWSLLKIVSNRL